MDDLIPRNTPTACDPCVSSMEAQVVVLCEIANDTKHALRDIRANIKEQRAETKQYFTDLLTELKQEIADRRGETHRDTAE